jgi:adenosylcobinamide kinase/adenosylcobinamide-phosphate guanylyltransferase
LIALVTGGSGCGKSTWAEKYIQSLNGRKFYIATMQVVDEECRARVERHRLQRAGLGFETLEMATDIGSASVEPGSAALVECLPTLMANEMFGGDPERVLPGLERLMDVCGHLVVVTNDVFSDGLTYDPETTAYMKKLAEVNRAVAERAEFVVEVVFSIPLALKIRKRLLSAKDEELRAPEILRNFRAAH